MNKEKIKTLLNSNIEQEILEGTELLRNDNLLSKEDKEDLINIFNTRFIEGNEYLTVEMIENVYETMKFIR